MRYHTHCHKVKDLKPATVIDLLMALNAFKQTNQFPEFLLACEADAKGRTGLEYNPYPQAKYLKALADTASTVTAAMVADTFTGEQIGTEIRRLRIEAVRALIPHLQSELFN
jgi:tRNA nucleotidyltransferase (CCA-adding enzyme)